MKNCEETTLLSEKSEEVRLSFIVLGSYGVVFKGVKKDDKDFDENNKRR